MANINLNNTSSTAHTYEINGNDGSTKEVTVQAGQNLPVAEADGWSGSVIAMDNGKAEEQSEISFGTGSQQDVFDESNITGGSGNETVQQTGVDSTLKGDPTFMQDLKQAYAGLSSTQKAQLGGSVQTDASGNAISIGAPKDSQALTDFVNSFDKGLAYVGVGAWDGSAGAAADNAQSEASGSGHSATINIADDNVAADGTGGGGGIVRLGNGTGDQPQSSGAASTASSTSLGAGTAPSTDAGAAATSSNSSAQTVQSAAGDTLWSIAEQHGIASVQDLVAANSALFAQYPSINSPPGSFNLPAGVTVTLPT